MTTIMSNENQKTKGDKNIAHVFTGMLLGSLAGAVTVLLLAPQSGKETRTQLKEKGLELRNRATEVVEDGVAQVRTNIDKITTSGREKIKELKQQGQELAADQLDRVSAAAQAGKKAIKGS
jgi:gas vesicle protein